MPPYSGIDGFLGTRASLMLDVVFLAMFAVVPWLALSIYLVRVKRLYALHKRLQVMLALVLFAAVALFEIDVRLHGWRERAARSPYFANREGMSPGDWLLAVHLCFAVSTTLLWIVVTVRALRNFPDPPAPSAHSRSHKFWAWLATIDMICTAVTGCTFYWLAFAA